MKKILLSTALMVATAGVAAAEVTLSGSGRFGLSYVENRDGSPTTVAVENETIISYRLRFNVDAKLEADNGVVYGGRIRFQNTEGNTTSPFSPAMLYVESNGLRVEVGNTNTAFDSVALMYNSEIGYLGSSAGNPQGKFYSFNSGPYAGNQANRVGIYAAYSISGLNLKASYVQTNQLLDTGLATDEDESSIAVDYTFGQITVAAAAAQNANGILDNDLTFVGAAYAFSDIGTVGINFNDNGVATIGDTITLYGNYKFGATTVAAYVVDADSAGSDTAYGLGAAYDLGGATLAGSVRSGFDGGMAADLGVSMSF